MCYGFSYVDKENGVPYFRVEDLDNPFIEIDSVVYIPWEEHIKFKRTHIKRGDILFAVRGNTIGRIGLNLIDKPANISPNVMAIRPKNLDLSYYLSVVLLSSIGRSQIVRVTSGTAQPTITEDVIQSILVPDFPKEKIIKISDIVKKAYSKHLQANQKYKEAENLLYEASGVEELELRDELSYTASNKDVETSGRLRFDADYYQPKYLKVLNLVKDGHSLKDIAIISEDTIDPTQTPTQKFKYISLKSINGATGKIEEIEEFLGWQAPSRARMLVKTNDVLVSSLKGSLDKVGFVPEELNGALASTGFFIVREKNRDYPAEVLFMLFRTPILTLQMEKLSSGAILEAVSKSAFKRLRIPAVKNKTLISKIMNLVREHFELRREARLLIQKAINSIELEIERLIRNASSGTS